jgi:hypothetical protein
MSITCKTLLGLLASASTSNCQLEVEKVTFTKDWFVEKLSFKLFTNVGVFVAKDIPDVCQIEYGKPQPRDAMLRNLKSYITSFPLFAVCLGVRYYPPYEEDYFI